MKVRATTATDDVSIYDGTSSTSGYQTVEADLSSLAGEEVTLVAETNDDANLRLDWIEVRRDTDGDGLRDVVENQSLVMPRGAQFLQPIDGLEYDDPRSDGDQLDDGTELRNVSLTREDESTIGVLRVTDAVANPTMADTDGDGLLDHREVDHLDRNNILTINKSGSAYRWEPDITEANGSIEWTSDPLRAHSDDDGLDDATEVRETHTHPRLETTYGITREHQALLVDAHLDGEVHLARETHIAETLADLNNLELNDATDDFDFVWDDQVQRTGTREKLYDRLTFQMIDDRNPERLAPVDKDKLRSDQWLSNSEELAFNELSDFLGVPRNPDTRLDVWDPDTDDDGLTDGQELFGLTRGEAGFGGRGLITDDRTLETSPVMPDSDGDGYWDGWIGVYGVGRTDNVVLYEEHLNDGNGVEGREIVQEQIKTHERTDEGPFGLGADIDEDSADEHSNLHLGELFWETDPTERGNSPSPSMTIEVDYHSMADSALNDSSWRESIEDNFALYGINVDLRRDEVLTNDDLLVARGGAGPGPMDYRPPFDSGDLLGVESIFHQTNADQYLFVASVAGPTVPGGSDQSGIHIWQGIPSISVQRIAAVFTTAHLDDLDSAPSGLTRDEKMRATAAKNTVHEIGHILDLGEADDQSGDEVYSGSRNDHSDEAVEETAKPGNLEVVTWSVMSSGINEENFIHPTDSDYTAFSIEEWTSMTVNRLNP